MAESPFFLGTDIGTFGTKSCIVDMNGQIASEAFEESDIIISHPGWAEQWPDVWWNVYCETVKGALKASKIDPKDIAGICISGLYSGSGIPVNKKFKPLRPCIIWMDRRATEETEWVKKTISEDEIFRITGNIIDPYYGYTKMLWIKGHEPKVWDETHQLMTAYEWCAYKLTGELFFDHSSACLIGGVYDIHKREWSEKLMNELGIPRRLFPEKLSWAKDIIGEITEEGAKATGLNKGTPVCAGGIDATVSALSVTALKDGDLASMIGTSMCNGFIQDELRLSRRLVNFPHVAYDTTKLYSFAGIVTAGAVIRWFRDQLGTSEKLVGESAGISAYKLLDMMAEKVPQGADGLVFTPHMVVGERAPYWDPYVRSCLFGLTLYHTKAHIYRAFLEGVAYAIRYSMEVAKEAGIPLKRAILVDGGAKSPSWRQIMTDVTNTPFMYVERAPGAPIGDALLAGVGVGLLKYEKIYDWIKITEVTKPNPKSVEIYEKYYDLYKKVYGSLEECCKLLKKISE
mgnify:CR=1 FL=1